MISYRKKDKRRAGFSLIEIMVVLLVALIVAAVAIPNILNAMRMYNLRGAASNFASLLQTARIRAVQDNRFYSVYVLAQSGSNPEEAYVDIYPQNANGTSGNGGSSMAALDPVVAISTEVKPIIATNAPNTANLSSQFLPSGSALVPRDGSSASSPISFGPLGLACTPQTVTGGTVCNSGGGPTAFWIFFQDSLTQAWEAVTITPGGRVQKWEYGGSSTSGTWGAL